MRNRIQKLLKPGETLYFYILPKQEYGIYDETFAFLADDGSRYPLHVTMNREKNPTEKKQLEITEKSAGVFRQCSGAIRHFRKQRHIF